MRTFYPQKKSTSKYLKRVDFDIAHQLLITYSGFVKYLRRNGNTLINASIIYGLQNTMMQLGGKFCILSYLQLKFQTVTHKYSGLYPGYRLSHFTLYMNLPQLKFHIRYHNITKERITKRFL